MFYRRKYWMIVFIISLMILYEVITMKKVSFYDIFVSWKRFILKKLSIEVPETIDNRQEAYIKRRVQQEERKEVVQMIKSEMLSNSIYEQQSHWINQTTNNGANLYLYSAYYVSIILPQLSQSERSDSIQVGGIFGRIMDFDSKKGHQHFRLLWC